MNDKQSTARTMTDMLAESEIATVKQIISHQLGVELDQVTPQAALETDLSADSLDKVEITMRLEEQFQVTIPDELAEDVETVEDVLDVVAQALRR